MPVRRTPAEPTSRTAKLIELARHGDAIYLFDAPEVSEPILLICLGKKLN